MTSPPLAGEPRPSPTSGFVPLHLYGPDVLDVVGLGDGDAARGKDIALVHLAYTLLGAGVGVGIRPVSGGAKIAIAPADRTLIEFGRSP